MAGLSLNGKSAGDRYVLATTGSALMSLGIAAVVTQVSWVYGLVLVAVGSGLVSRAIVLTRRGRNHASTGNGRQVVLPGRQSGES